MGKLKTVAVDVVEKDRMKVRWRLDCSDRVGIVTGYRISFCAIESLDDTAECADEEQSVIARPEEEAKVVEGLRPWTLYKVGYVK